MMSGHGGNMTRLAEKLGCNPEDILDFSANINPLGPPPFLRRVINNHIRDLVHYPDPECRDLVEAISTGLGIAENKVVVGNGTSELLFKLPAVLKPKRALIPAPAYIDYARACSQADVPVRYIDLDRHSGFAPDLQQIESMIRPGDLVILGQPNNPTGTLVDREQLLALMERQPEVFFIIDEAFAGFVGAYKSVAGCTPNCITLCSLTKIFAIPGLRLGFLAASAEICRSVREHSAPWAVNTLAQAVGVVCLGEKQYIKETCRLVDTQRKHLSETLADLPHLYPYEGTANFLLIGSDHPQYSGAEIAEKLLSHHRIAVRGCANYQNLDASFFRVAVRTESENQRLVQALQSIIEPSSKGKPEQGKVKKKPALMLLGTGSDVGKSVLVAALGRILLQDGLRVAPFKAQNMSLNSYVTRDGGEMGRAQVVQAQACRLDPDVRMNPVLLKPSSDVGSQVIVNGRPVGNMKVAQYVAYKSDIWQKVCRAYDSLAADYDVLLLEGAGSPGEVNLKAHDIVNTRMAGYAEAEALLVGDIDRGGVYASFIGHLEVMDPWERELIAGFVVNRFRGDASLLADAHEYMLDHTGKPVLGVVPYLKNLGLPQEDSVGFKAGLFTSERPAGVHVEVVVVDLPHISNFTDIEPFFEEPDVFLRIVGKQEEIGNPDAIILPGSKNVPADLAFLHASGLVDSIAAASAKDVEIVGICGGFQMLGHRVTDTHGLEGNAGEECLGLGLLDMETALALEKTLTSKTGLHLPSGCRVQGYEIHHGLSHGSGQAIITFDDGSSCGQGAHLKNVWGVYLHGIFDGDGFRRWWINRLRTAKGLEPLSGQGAVYDLEPALDRLAQVVRENLDMDTIYRLLSL